MRPLCISEPKNDLGKTVWLKFEVTNEVTDEKSRKKSSVFKGFRRQGVKSTASRLPVARRSSASANLTYPRDNFHCFSVRLWTLFCRKLDGFGVVRVPQKCSVLLRKEQARSTQGTRIASENKNLMKQEIVPQGAYLLLFCAARLFLLPFRSC